MSSPSLGGISNELVVWIFQLLPKSRDVAALNCTSRKFYQIWRLNAALISDAVLPRTLDCYADAEELVRFQTAQAQEWEAEGSETDLPELNEASYAYLEVLKRNIRFAANASLISKECTDLQVDANRRFYRNLRGPDGEDMQRENLLYLMHVRYRIHSIVALSNDQAAQDAYVEATSLDDLRNMDDESIWINPRHHYTDWEYFRIYLKMASARNPFDLIEQVYVDKLRREYSRMI